MTYRERYVFGAPPDDEPPTVAAILNRIANRALEHEKEQDLQEALESVVGGPRG